MKNVLLALKWLGRVAGVLLVLLLFIGGGLRLSHTMPRPPGELVDIGGLKLHIHATGPRSDRPTLVIEGGAGSPTEFYHWLNEGLKDSMRVVRYDRAGIAHSEAGDARRTPDVIARQLHQLLAAAGEAPPYILAGHSMGGPYAQVFTELYPKEVVGLALLDATHPGRIEAFKIPPPSSIVFRSVIGLHHVQALLADLGILRIYDWARGPILGREMEGLPDSINRNTTNYLFSGRYLRTLGREMAQYHATLARVDTDQHFGALPLLVFPSAPHEIPDEVNRQHLESRGVDLKQGQIEKMRMQRDFLKLSTNSKLIPMTGDHNTIYTVKENADVICAELLNLWRDL